MDENKPKVHIMERFHPKAWGSELWIINTPLYCGKILTLDYGHRCSMHYHKKKDETFFVDGGIVYLEHDEGGVLKERVMRTGDTQRILPGAKHRFTGLVHSRIIEFSAHHEESDSYREEESGKIDVMPLWERLGIMPSNRTSP